MDLTKSHRRVLTAIQRGLPLTSRPFSVIGKWLDLSEDRVLETFRSLINGNIIRRFGIVIRQHEFGYRANAMVAWELPEETVDGIRGEISKFAFVAQCCHSSAGSDDWPYNLICIVYGRDRKEIKENILKLTQGCGLVDVHQQVLFSVRRFRQRGVPETK